MKKINLKVLIITCIVTLLPIILGIIFYSELPTEVAIHFDVNNNPNGYFSKPAFVFGMPIIMVLFQIFCCIVSDLSDKNPEANKKMVTVSKWIIPILTIILYIVTIMYALGSSIDIRKIVMIILGIIFIVMGNYLPKTVGNNYIRIPKTKIKDENLNKKILRISGYMLIIDGILCLISILFNSIVSVAIVCLIILEGIGLSVYSFVKDKKILYNK